MNAERSLDELFFVRDQVKQMQEERKRDVEETADFIKQIINQGKQDTAKELQRMSGEMDKMRRDVVDKCTLKELLEVKSGMMGIIE